MTFAWRLLIFAFLAIHSSAIVLHAQSPAPSPAPYIETFEVRLHNIDVVVTDAGGRSVQGLRKEDFEVTEDGVPQTLTNFSVFHESSGSTTLAASSNAGDSVAADALPARRLFVFFIDEIAVHAMTRRKLLNSAAELVRTSMKPGDQAMIVTPAAEETIALPFTGDRNAVLAKLEAVINSSFGLSGNSQIRQERLYLSHSMSTASGAPEQRHIMRTYARMVNRRVEQRLGQLRSIVAALGEVPGRKVLMLVTESLSATPGAEAFRPRNVPGENRPPTSGLGSDTDTTTFSSRYWTDQRPAIRDIARKASSNGITIYSLQPEYGLNLVLGGGGSAETRSGGTVGGLGGSFMNDSITGTEITMASLTELTGGKWYRGDGPVDDVFEQVANDLDAYYSLGYPAPEGSADVARTIKVRVRNRPELRVRFRKEIVKKSVSQEMTDQVVAHLIVPRPNNELGISVNTAAPVMDEDTRVVDVEVRVPMDRLLFLPDADHGYKAQFAVHYAAIGQSADFVAGENRQQSVTITADEMPKIAGKTWKYSTRLRLPLTEMKVAFGVLDTTSRLTGFETVTIAAEKDQKRSKR